MEFLPLVEQLEVVFYRLDEYEFLANYCHEGEETDSTYSNGCPSAGKEADEYFRGFWQRIQARFPRVSRIVLFTTFPQTLATLPEKDCKRIKQMCIPGIEVFFSFLTCEDRQLERKERHTWRELKDNESPCEIDGWAEVPNYDQPRIIMPPKKFRGPIGTYESWRYKAEQLRRRVDTVKTMLITAKERHHFYGRHEPFTCPFPDCEA